MATNTVIQQSYRRERFRRFGFSVVASLLSRGFGMVITLVTIPPILNYLGAERYAIWVTLGSIVTLLTFADLGIGNGLINAISEANGKDDRLLARKFVSNAFAMLFILSVFMGIIFALLYPVVPWARIYNVNSSLAESDAGPVTALFVACFLVGMPLSVVQKAQLGFQEAYIENLWFIGGKICSLIAVVILIQLDAGFLWLIFSLVGIPVIAVVLNGVQLFFLRRPWLFPTIADIKKSVIRLLVKLGWLFFVLQIAGAIAYNIDNLVIAQMVSSQAVTEYSLSAQLFKFVTVIVSLVSLPLWPAYGEAIARGDVSWIRKAFKRSVAINFIISGLFSAILIVLGSQILSLWVGEMSPPPLVLLCSLGIWTTMFNVSNALAMLFNAANVIRFQVFWATIMAISNLCMSIIFVGHLGSIGVLVGSICSYSIFIFPPYLWRTARLFSSLELKTQDMAK